MKKDVKVIVVILVLVLSATFGAVSIYNKNKASRVESTPATASSSPLAETPTQTETSSPTPASLVQEKLPAWPKDLGSPTLGPMTARVKIVEYLDPECESCRLMHPIVKSLLKQYSGKIHYTVRYMPFHKNSIYAASMLEAARLQGKYWEALDLLFAKQQEWGAHHDPRPELIPEILATLGLDQKKLLHDARHPGFNNRIQNDRSEGMGAGVTGTPTFFVNNKMLQELGEAPLKAAIQAEFTK